MLRISFDKNKDLKLQRLVTCDAVFLLGSVFINHVATTRAMLCTAVGTSQMPVNISIFSLEVTKTPKPNVR